MIKQSSKILSSHFLSLIIPAYKKEKQILENIKAIKNVLDKIRYDYEILVIVDGDLDDTYKKLKNAHLKKVVGDYLMFLDCGMEIDPNGISMLLEHMEWYKADIIVGSKRHAASQVNYSFSRKL